ncbi:MAG: porin [Rhodobacterales bacterium]|nr:porin [Rhodobacterales bacterium]
MIGRTFLSGAITAAALVAGTGVWAQPVTLNDTDEGEEIITLPKDGEKLTYGYPSGGTFTVYGQFNPVYQSFDDGQNTTSGLVDNGNWNSRVGFRYVVPLGETTMRLRFETGLGLRNSASVSQLRTPEAWRFNRNFLRWFEAAFDTSYGTFSFGQGSLASDGVAGMDESFTFVAGATDSSDGFGSFQFTDRDGNLTGVSVGSVNSAINGARRFRARYDTPSFSGFVFSTSYGVNVLNQNDEADYYDIAMRWNGEVGEFTIQTAVAYGWEDEPVAADRERLSGSATFLHNPTGLSLNVSAGSLKDGPEYAWVRAGWRNDFLASGTTSLSVDYYLGEDFRTAGSETENYGFYAVQSFDDLSLDIYTGIRRFNFSDLTGQTYQGATGILVGARWFF